MEGVRARSDLTLQVIATGMHLSPTFGSTYREIEGDGFAIDRKIEMLMGSDSDVGVAKSIGVGTIGLADALAQLGPDVLLVLGDRFEIFAAVAAALPLKIPVAHVHGGETTEGAFDEGLRHAITKMSHLHFVAAEEYRQRVIQLGESPDRVHLVGGLGVDAIKHVPLMDRSALEAALGFEFGRRNLLVTYHPATLEDGSTEEHMAELLAALEVYEDVHVIFTMPNADPGNQPLFRMIDQFVARHPRCRAYRSLGHARYLSCMAQVDGVVGNSSSGLLEAPSFGKPTVNIGERQRGRLRAASVIDCAADRRAIAEALRKLFSAEFQAVAKSARNPYGEGGASEKIVRILAEVPLAGLLAKSFHDLRGAT
jgi:GDP/UDP-N,N'-diacetylbacillosamine 2-epimerase (hydrolysing)